MSGLLISFLTLVLILISVFVILLVLMQRTSQSAGMGAALGGGAAESAFGSDTSNVLTKGTIYSTIAFFVVSMGLFLMYQSKVAERTKVLDPVGLISPEETDPLAKEVESVFDMDLTGTEVQVDTAEEPTVDQVDNVEVPAVEPATDSK